VNTPLCYHLRCAHRPRRDRRRQGLFRPPHPRLAQPPINWNAS